MHGRTTGLEALRHPWARRALVATTLVAVLAPVVGAPPASAGEGHQKEGHQKTVEVIVRPEPGRDAESRSAIERLGGAIAEDLGPLGGIVAEVPKHAVKILGSLPEVASATAAKGKAPEAPTVTEWKEDVDLGPISTVTQTIGATQLWRTRDLAGNRFTGRGVGVALLDSGVVPVEGLSAPGKVVNGPDLSFESQVDELRHLDTYGHGTHMAGIIAGRDASVPAGGEATASGFVGVAPDAHIVNLKLAAADGSTDVSQVIAAIDWAVEHRDDPGLNIRVLNLSYGTEALQSYQVDPLAFAVENAWRKGIVVVVAAGNDGAEGTTLTNPAISPYVIAVGASDTAGTTSRKDDVLADFSSVGNAKRQPDVLAPGRSLLSLRAPGSWVDEEHPTARAALGGEERLFRGSGSSQAAAVVSGAVALMLDVDPRLTPDQVKAALVASGDEVGGPSQGQGAGLIDLRDPKVLLARLARPQRHAPATGTGSLDLARGGAHVADPETGELLVGEQDIFGTPWDGAAWADATAREEAWQGGTWNGKEWSGSAWTGSSWAGTTWEGRSWRDASWTGRSWREVAWTGRSWRDASWTGRSWRDAVWTGRSWRDASWTGRSWRSTDW